MAKTIQEAGGMVNGGALPTSQEILNNSNIATPTVQAGNKLAGDLMGIMGEGAKVVQADNTASVKAAQRVASDSLTSMSKDLAKIKEETQPNAVSMRNAQKANEAVYQFYGRKTFDNEDAQSSFDKNYHDTASVSIADMNSSLEVGALKLDADAQVIAVTDAIQSQVDLNVKQTSDMYNGYVETITAGGYYTKLQAENLISGIYIQSLQGDYETLKNLPIYKEDGSIDMAIASKVYNARFGNQSEMSMDKGKEEEGYSVKAVGDTNVEIVNAQQNAFNALLKSFTKNTSNIKIDTTQVPATTGSTTIRTNTQRIINENNKAIQSNNSGGATYSKSSQFTANKAIASEKTKGDIVEEVEMSVQGVIDGDVNYEDVSKDHTRQTNYVNPTTDKLSNGTVTVSKSTVDSVYKGHVTQLEKTVQNSQNIDEIDKSVYDITKLEVNTNHKIKSPYIVATYKDVSDGVIKDASNMFEMMKSVTVANIYGNTITDNTMTLGWLRQKDENGQSKMVQVLQAKYYELQKTYTDSEGRIDPNKEKEAMIKYNFLIHTLSRQFENNVTKGDGARQVRSAMQELRSDKDMINYGFGTESTTSTTANTIIAGAVGAEVPIDDIKSYTQNILDNQTTEISSSVDWIFAGDSIVILTPDGGATPKNIVNKIEIDISNGLKDLNFSDVDIGEDTNVEISSDRIDGQLGTVVIVRHKQTNAIIYSKVYTGSTLSNGVSNEDEAKLEATRAEQKTIRDERNKDFDFLKPDAYIEAQKKLRASKDK